MHQSKENQKRRKDSARCRTLEAELQVGLCTIVAGSESLAEACGEFGAVATGAENERAGGRRTEEATEMRDKIYV